MRTFTLAIVVIILCFKVRAQSFEAQQLLLNWEKLAQLKEILENMYKGYEVMNKGYTRIKEIAAGNYTLHQDFLDRLLEVNPVVGQYKKVADVVGGQRKLLREQKEARAFFRRCESFSPEELQYLDGVYENLLKESLKNVEELVLVITPGKLRMSDEERLKAIDRIETGMQEKLRFLYAFNTGTKVLYRQRKSEAASIDLMRKWYGVK